MFFIAPVFIALFLSHCFYRIVAALGMTLSSTKAPPLEYFMSTKILLLYAHPDNENSQVNRLMIDMVKNLPNVYLHDLYAAYPDFFIDITREHQLLAEHDMIVFQHPLYMYSCPSLMKEWIDRVLGKHFAFGSGDALKGKYWRSVITTGGKESAFCPQGYNRYPLAQILSPFELTAALCQMHWLAPIVLYWSRHVDDSIREQHFADYKNWLIAATLTPAADQVRLLSRLETTKLRSSARIEGNENHGGNHEQ